MAERVTVVETRRRVYSDDRPPIDAHASRPVGYRGVRRSTDAEVLMVRPDGSTDARVRMVIGPPGGLPGPAGLMSPPGPSWTVKGGGQGGGP